jgi:hypothetical protein
MRNGTYVGPQEVLKGKTALLKGGPIPGTVQAQFNDLSLGLGFTHTWLMFEESDFCWDQDFDDV